MIDDDPRGTLYAIKKALAEHKKYGRGQLLAVEPEWLTMLVEYYAAAEAAGFINPSDKLRAARKQLEGE